MSTALRRPSCWDDAHVTESGDCRVDPFNHYELALAAPREEIGREIRRVAVSFPQASFFLWRVGIRLHHFAVQMPGGMTEHRQNHRETDEERQ